MKHGDAVYLAFDPGPICGFATFNEQGYETFIGQATYPDELVKLYREFDPSKIKHVIWEGYRIFRKKAGAHVGKPLETVQCVGSIRSWCSANELQFTEQPASILSTAQMWTQIFIPSDHSISHQFSALNHGAYWLINKGIRKTYLEAVSEKEHGGR